MINTGNIIIADDHQMVIDGLKGMIGRDKRWKVTAEANNGQAAFDMIGSQPQHFSILITDISMPAITGIELCSMVKSRFPHIAVLIVSMHSSASAVKEAVMAEADGFLLKNTTQAELHRALHRISEGGTYFSQDITPLVWKASNRDLARETGITLLTNREKQVLALIADELTSEEIAEKLFISKKTVDHHRKSLFVKCDCSSTVGLVKFAIKHGICKVT